MLRASQIYLACVIVLFCTYLIIVFYTCLYIILFDYLKDALFALTNSQVIFIAVFWGVLNFDVCNMT
jgi:hypothetical protein